jgi:hypothetical protein
MEKDEIIKQKFLNTWPKSWAIFEESCQYSIKHNLDFVVGILLNEEKEISYADQKSVWEQLCDYLKTLGYQNVHGNGDTFLTKDGYKKGMSFVVFLSSAAIKSYINENERWNKYIENHGSWAEQSKMRPIYHSIKYLNIYKND